MYVEKYLPSGFYKDSSIEQLAKKAQALNVDFRTLAITDDEGQASHSAHECAVTAEMNKRGFYSPTRRYDLQPSNLKELA